MSHFSLPTPAGQVNPTAGVPAARRCRAAVALALACEKQAREPSNPLATRERAAVEAREALALAWSLLVSWTVDAGPCEASGKAAAFIGALDRRFVLLGSMLRAEAGLPLSFDGDAREAALAWPPPLSPSPASPSGVAIFSPPRSTARSSCPCSRSARPWASTRLASSPS